MSEALDKAKANVKEFLKFFKFTNQWNSPRQGDKINLGIVGDWSDCVVEGTFRVGIVNILAFGYDWADTDYEFFFTILNFKFGVKIDKKKPELLQG